MGLGAVGLELAESLSSKNGINVTVIDNKEQKVEKAVDKAMQTLASSQRLFSLWICLLDVLKLCQFFSFSTLKHGVAFDL